jgi:predicted nucleic acid-binding protein
VIVADASAVAEVLLARPGASAVRRAFAEHAELHVPEHFHVEVLSVLRRYAARGELTPPRAVEAVGALRSLRAVRYPVMEMAALVWELREELTAYDAAYLALAIRLEAGLVTLDKALARSAASRGHLAQI